VKTPIHITTLEEDFRKIGLIRESKEAPTAPAATSEDTGADADEQLDEAGRIKYALRGGKKVKQQKTSMADRMAAKKFRRSAAGKKAARLQAKKLKTSKGRRRAAKVAAKAIAKGTRQEAVSAEETMKGFAEAAIIADKLSTIFTEWVKADIYEAADERMFAGLAGQLGEIAESFADIATAMSEGQLQESAEDIDAAFTEGLETILDAVDLYEANDEDEDEDEDEAQPGNG
jgi:hypothetical protein